MHTPAVLNHKPESLFSDDTVISYLREQEELSPAGHSVTALVGSVVTPATAGDIVGSIANTGPLPLSSHNEKQGNLSVSSSDARSRRDHAAPSGEPPLPSLVIRSHGATASSSGSAGEVSSAQDPDTAPDREQELKNIKAKLRRVLLRGLPLIGAKAVELKPEEKRAHVADSGHHTLDGSAQQKELLWGWPQHPLWRKHEDALIGTEGRLNKQDHVDKESKLTNLDYIRIDSETIARKGPTFLWRHGEMPGKSDKLPTNADPMDYTQGDNQKERSTTSVKRADLRNLYYRNLTLTKYTNVMCHGTDLLHKLAARNTKPDSPDRELFEDTLFIMKRTLDNMLGATVASGVSHNVYERLLAQERDNRRTVFKLDPFKLARARLAPIDSDTFIFGTQRTVLKDHIKEKIDEKKHVVITTGGAAKPFSKPGQGGQRAGGGKKTTGAGKTGNKPAQAPQGAPASTAKPPGTGKKSNFNQKKGGKGGNAKK